MKIGTRSLLFGVHCFFIHPFFVAFAWRKLYGFPWKPQLWAAFFLHDIGYWRMPNMDGKEGEGHPVFGAYLMSLIFDRKSRRKVQLSVNGNAVWIPLGEWGLFTLCHSRFFSHRIGREVSRLCVADKSALASTPAWLYLPLARLTGELEEYMERAASLRYQALSHQAPLAERTMQAAVQGGYLTPRLWLAIVRQACAEFTTRHATTATPEPK